MNATTDDEAKDPAWIIEARRQNLVACRRCDGIHLRIPLLRGERARCLRCDTVLYHNLERPVESGLPLLLAAMVFFIASNLWPIAEMRVQGVRMDVSIWACIELMNAGRMTALPLLMLATTMILPSLELSIRLALALGQPHKKRRSGSAAIRLLNDLRPWIVSELYMLGMLVTLYQISAMGTLIIGTAAISAGLLMMTLAAMLFFDSWDR